MTRLARWFLRHDPTTACDWTPEEADETAEKLVAAVFDLAALKAENARLRARLTELEAEADELNQENMALHLQLTEAQIAAGALESLPPLPSLRLVPPRRDGSEYEWPALAREIQTDDLTALMRAVEES
jgi:chromosome segregation ATPase